MRKIIYAGLVSVAFAAQGEIPENYYNSLDGKSGDALLTAVKTVAHPGNFKRVTYGDKTWQAFEKTDTRVVDGVTVWWDMYSNIMVPANGHDGLNIEHSVANSWFGGKKGSADAYADLFHLNPSNEAANNKKGDTPLGEVAEISWENGLVKIGSPKPGTAGTAAKVFEPADEYKGDFARAFFYIFMSYDTAPWIANQPMYSFTDKVALEPWAVDMLRRWAAEDPVDSKEQLRNEEVYKLQNNRNPFIDYPSLIEYIWGDLKTATFTVGEPVEAVDRPVEPGFTSHWITGVNTYSGRWWDAGTVGITHDDGDLWVSINGGDYQQFGPGVDIPAATEHGATLNLAAYSEREIGGYTLRSSIARLTLTAKDPDAEDFTECGWTPVMSDEDFSSSTGHYFIVRSVSNGNIMGYNGGTKSSAFMPDAGFVKENDEMVYRLPVDAAILRFRPGGADKYVIEVLDPVHHVSKGFWNVDGTANKNTLDATTGTAASVSIDTSGAATISFEGGKALRYNKSQPRFTNYNPNVSNNTCEVSLARYTEIADIPSGIGEDMIGDEGFIAVDGNDIYVPGGWKIFALNGRLCSGHALEAGIYIVRSPKGKAVKILIK